MNPSPTQGTEYVDEVCLRFEDAWKKARSPEQRPRLEAFLDATPESLRTELLHELVGLEIDYRRQNGEHPQAQEYRARFPFLDPECLQDLLGTAPEGAASSHLTTPPGRAAHESTSPRAKSS